MPCRQATPERPYSQSRVGPTAERAAYGGLLPLWTPQVVCLWLDQVDAFVVGPFQIWLEAYGKGDTCTPKIITKACHALLFYSLGAAQPEIASRLFQGCLPAGRAFGGCLLLPWTPNTICLWRSPAFYCHESCCPQRFEICQKWD
jgi:hypothetical protein